MKSVPMEQNSRMPAAVKKPKIPKVKRNREKPIQKYRLAIQMAFVLLCIWIGVEFHFFVRYLESCGAVGSASRPPGVEGFLPISSLMSLYYFFLTGQVHWAHPAGLFILVAIIAMSFVFGKAFCSWLCPVGTLSEFVGDVGEKLFGRRIHVPRILDYPLRSLKYLLLGFFLYSIFFAMSTVALRVFLDSPYNIVADVKMYYFFADISRFALIVIGVLFLLSIVIRNFWCRYLCPYGALLGLLSFLSPTRIKRNPVTCIDCGKCAKACPSRIKVDKVNSVFSDECTSCMNCIDVCPIAETLELKTTVANRRISKRWVAVGVVGMFLIITGLGIFTGHWQNTVTTEQYLGYQKSVAAYGHPTNSEDIATFNKEAQERAKPTD